MKITVAKCIDCKFKYEINIYKNTIIPEVIADAQNWFTERLIQHDCKQQNIYSNETARMPRI